MENNNLEFLDVHKLNELLKNHSDGKIEFFRRHFIRTGIRAYINALKLPEGTIFFNADATIILKKE